MPKTQTELTATYRRNLAWFDQHFPDLYQRIVDSNSAPEYLLGLRNNQYFDIQNTHTKAFVYNADPERLAQKSADFICQTSGNYLVFARPTPGSERPFPPIGALDRIDDYVKQHPAGNRVGGDPRKIILFGAGLGLQI